MLYIDKVLVESNYPILFICKNKNEDNTQKKPENKEIEEQEKIRKIIDGVLEGTEKNKKENKETEEEQEAKA